MALLSHLIELLRQGIHLMYLNTSYYNVVQWRSNNFKKIPSERTNYPRCAFSNAYFCPRNWTWKISASFSFLFQQDTKYHRKLTSTISIKQNPFFAFIQSRNNCWTDLDIWWLIREVVSCRVFFGIVYVKNIYGSPSTMQNNVPPKRQWNWQCHALSRNLACLVKNYVDWKFYTFSFSDVEMLLGPGWYRVLNL